ncbi:heparinase II/III family protein [Mucilaginibacter boryungensis]|uniref:Heparinase II/III family protein n=2 Tax=Mucilaginibacter boryungensis TaxID=768480 RepID=A0ABR9XDN3_9SPHI|nr:heparinase II/III family protein [Mucilaginibacter boryungensis]
MLTKVRLKRGIRVIRPIFRVAIMLLMVGLLTLPAYATRIYGGYYTAARIANLRNNCNTYEWAKQQRTTVIARAKAWVAKSDDELWAIVPGQDLPRCIDVTFDRLTTGPKFLGCLNCGKKVLKYGTYPYEPDFINKPWKLSCPACGAIFPTNDFGKYYQSGINKAGVFDPAKADKKLLYNTTHPDPKDPLYKYGVDDGYGYIDKNGRSYRYIGYYTWKYWDNIRNGLSYLADAFLYTGDQQYAHKAAILLDRIADVYPTMDWKPYADRGWFHSDKGTGKGKIQGSIWENGTAQRFADDYDKIISGTVNDDALYAFLKKKSETYVLPTTKGNRDLFVKNIDDNILRCAFKAVVSGQIFGNEGMQQLTAAKCAVALNTNPETTQWLDWIFSPTGGAIPKTIINQFDHDGSTNEGAPNYSVFLGIEITNIASLLDDYPAYTKHNFFKEFPQLSATFTLAYRWAALGIAIPNIGDSGATGLVSMHEVNVQFMAKGFRYTNDPDIAIAAYRANKNSAAGLGRDIFSKDPDSLSRIIKQIAGKAGPRPIGGYLMSGFGLALLEDSNGASGIALANNYGRTIKHAHPDMLNFDIFAFGHWLTPDFGYPEFATDWPNNTEWSGSTLSHNTVFVDKHPQKEIWSGHTQLFKQLKGFGVFEIDGKKAYPEIKEYRRTMLLIGGNNDKNAYVVDIFHVEGGKDHVYSLHGPPGAVATTGLNLIVQPSGTYAGENIPKGALAKTDFPIGYSYLYNVKRDPHPPAQFILDWKANAGYRGLTAQDDVHLRMYALNQCNDVALADGDPPQNKAGNPENLGFVLMHRSGNELNSTFVSVIEPYEHSPFIKSVKRLDDGKGSDISIQVEKTDGSMDYVLYNSSSQKITRLKNGMNMTGTVGYINTLNGKPQRGVLVDGTSLNYGKMHLHQKKEITGKIIKMNKETSGGGWIWVDAKLPVDGTLNGQQIIVDTEYDRDAAYTIRSAARDGNLTKIYCGPICFVRGQKGNKYLYDFDEGAVFKIPLHAAWDK